MPASHSHRTHVAQRITAMVIPAVLAAVALVQAACGAEATLMSAQMTRDEPGERPGIFIAAHYEFDLPQPLLDALHRGIPLYFAHEFSLVKERWYWFDKETDDAKFIIRLAFNPLTRRYGVSYSGLSLGFDSIEQALPLIKSIRRWRVAPSNAIPSQDGYEAQLRFYLDTSKLPKPMQVTNEGNEDWTIDSGWQHIVIPPEVVDNNKED